MWARLAGLDARIGDGLLAFLVLMLEVAIYGSQPPPEPIDNDIVVFLALLATTAPLVWRRRAPLIVLLSVSVSAGLAGGFGHEQALIPLWIAIYTAATHRDLSKELISAMAVAVLATLGLELRTTGGLGETAGLLFFQVALPIALGRAAFARRRWIAREKALTAQKMVDAEKARLAREIHDVVAHAIGVMVVQAGGARLMLTQSHERAEEALLSIEETGRVGLSELRRLLEGGGSTEEDAPLAPQRGLEQLDDLLGQFRTAGLDVRKTVRGTPRALPPSLDLSAYRIIQEALTNTLKHAGSVETEVVVHFGETELEIGVTDEGRSHAGSNPVEGGSGRGLVGMRERVDLLGGELHTGPRPSGGFEVRARLPLPGWR